MNYRHLSFFTLLLLSGWAVNSALGQEVLITDQNWPQKTAGLKPLQGYNKTTGGDSIFAPIPFFDDFSAESTYPSPVLWATGGLLTRVPGISIKKGIAPPSKGVVTLDGATYDGFKYEVDLASGPADSLVSRPIDLSSLSPADSVYLSFSVQPGGRSDKPEFLDSLVLQFDDSVTSASRTYRTVWSVTGDSFPSDTFVDIMLPLDNPIWFHPTFRFKFIAYGSLNGELDAWHIDYVYLDKNRSLGDLDYEDAGLADVSGAPFGPYTALPISQWPAMTTMQPMTAWLSNHHQVAVNNGTLSVELLNANGEIPLAGVAAQNLGSISIPSHGRTQVTIPPFNPPTLPIGNSPATTLARFIFSTTSLNDQVPSNDTLRIKFPVQNFMALDDGVSDAGYGLTVNRSFAVEYTVAQPDTLIGVAICFTPTLYFNGTSGQSTCMEGKPFKLIVWSDFHPDSIAYQYTPNIDYGDSLNDFIIYDLPEAIPVSGDFWVGIRQTDFKPVGVGFDRNVGNAGKLFIENNLGEFVASTQQGALMIRPVFAWPSNIVNKPETAGNEPLRMEIYPNPVENGLLNVSLSGADQPGSGFLLLRDLNGRTLASQFLGRGGIQRMTLPQGLPGGIYFIEATGTTRNGKEFSLNSKLMIPK